MRSSAKLKLNINILCVSFTTPSGTFDNKNNPIECASKQSKYNANFKMRTFIVISLKILYVSSARAGKPI